MPVVLNEIHEKKIYIIIVTDHSPNLRVFSLTPNSGPITGGTEVQVTGAGVRDFGGLMKCKFGNVIVQGKLRTNPGSFQINQSIYQSIVNALISLIDQVITSQWMNLFALNCTILLFWKLHLPPSIASRKQIFELVITCEIVRAGEKFSPFNNDIMICVAPLSLNATVVSVEISLTGETYTTDNVPFTYFGKSTQ
jgi:hypothetical protein